MRQKLVIWIVDFYECVSYSIQQSVRLLELKREERVKTREGVKEYERLFALMVCALTTEPYSPPDKVEVNPMAWRLVTLPPHGHKIARFVKSGESYISGQYLRVRTTDDKGEWCGRIFDLGHIWEFHALEKIEE